MRQSSRKVTIVLPDNTIPDMSHVEPGAVSSHVTWTPFNWKSQFTNPQIRFPWVEQERARNLNVL